MKIGFENGRKGAYDRIITVTTTEKEWIGIMKLGLLVNQLAVNELQINKGKIERSGRFFLKEVLLAAIENAEGGIDWLDGKNKQVLIDLCKKVHLNFGGFENENTIKSA